MRAAILLALGIFLQHFFDAMILIRSVCFPTPPMQNRMKPFGDFQAVPSKGLMMGNREILHDEKGALGSAHWKQPHWVV